MEFEDGKYSNLLLNDYFIETKGELSRKEKAFITLTLCMVGSFQSLISIRIDLKGWNFLRL